MTRASILNGVKQTEPQYFIGMGNAKVNQTLYATINGAGGQSNTEAIKQCLIGTAGTLRHLRAKIDAAAGAGESVVVTLRVNGADKAITVTFAGATQTEANDLTHEVVVAVGDKINYKMVSSAGAPANNYIAWSLEFVER